MHIHDDQIGVRGVWDFFVVDDGGALTQAEKELIMAGADIGRGVSWHHHNNIIPTVGRQRIAYILSGSAASLAECEINYQELGTGTATPANGDTGLQTPAGGTTRKLISSASYSSNVMTITSFWAAGEATGTWREFGTFINGTGTSNSGVLFSRVAINIPITGSQSLVIDGTVTLT